ncbi:hypothetical protein IVB46_08520, partial [Bradyrhizobium sp. 61]|nr:hypothetical protein [Bradyrhizobium sp. 61]
RNPTRSDGASATVLPNGFKKRIDINPQLKGRLTKALGVQISPALLARANATIE